MGKSGRGEQLSLEVLEKLRRQLQDCIDGGYGNARTPIDWFSVGPILIDAAERGLKAEALVAALEQISGLLQPPRSAAKQFKFTREATALEDAQAAASAREVLSDIKPLLGAWRETKVGLQATLEEPEAAI